MKPFHNFLRFAALATGSAYAVMRYTGSWQAALAIFFGFGALYWCLKAVASEILAQYKEGEAVPRLKISHRHRPDSSHR